MMGKRKTYITLVALTILLLLLPLTQMLTHIVNVKPLSGVIKKQKLPSFEFKDWMDYKYQPQLYKYLLDNYGFRENFIRLYNQVFFSLYKKGNANVTVGIDNYLFEPWFINSFNGKNYIGDEKISENIRKLQMIQDTLNSLNKELIIYLAPGKVSYWPEFVPEGMILEEPGMSNYRKYSFELSQSEIKFIDGNSWFMAAKDTSRYHLFPKTGTHWSYYGSCLAYDSLLSYVRINTEFNIVKTQIKDVHLTSNLKKTDRDIENILNLLIPLNALDLPYPKLKLLNKESAYQPDAIIISDSYFWNIFNSYPVKNAVFNNFQFWYYNKTVYPDNYKTPTKTTDLDFSQVVDETEIFILIACPQTIEKLGWGFIDNTYNYFYK